MYRLSDFIEKEAKTKQGEISADAGYTQDDVESFSDAWRARQKALKSGKGYDPAKIQTDAINQIDQGTQFKLATGDKSLGTKLKAGSQLLTKNIGNWGGQSKSIDNARSWENYQDRVKKTAAGITTKNPKLAGAKDVAKAATWSNPLDKLKEKYQDAKGFMRMGNYSKATRQAQGKTVSGGLNTAKNIGWGLAAGVPLLAGLWGMGRMMKPGQQDQQQQQQAPQSPFAAKYYRGV